MLFVGPAPATLAGLGDKIAARQSARANDVPIVPGTFEPIAVGGPGDDERDRADGRGDRVPGAGQGGRRRRRSGHAPSRRAGRAAEPR